MSALVPNRFIWLKSTLLTNINALYAYGCQSRRMLIKRGDCTTSTTTTFSHHYQLLLLSSSPLLVSIVSKLLHSLILKPWAFLPLILLFPVLESSMARRMNQLIAFLRLTIPHLVRTEKFSPRNTYGRWVVHMQP